MIGGRRLFTADLSGGVAVVSHRSSKFFRPPGCRRKYVWMYIEKARFHWAGTNDDEDVDIPAAFVT
jgi:hypothetical protein